MTRLPAPDMNTLDERQRAVANAIATGPRGGVHGPLAVWLHRPELAANAQALGRYCRFETSLPARLSEVAILTTAVVWGSGFEWSAHEVLARRAGVPEATIEALREGAHERIAADDERIVARFSHEAQSSRRVGDALYNEAREALGEAALVDLVGILGYYCLISMTINVFEVPDILPDDF